MAFTVARQRASFRLAASLGHVAKMPRIRFYNRRLASRAPAGNITSGDPLCRAVARKLSKPADVRLRDPPRPWRFHLGARATPDHLAVIQPPAATCLTARHRLRVVRRSPCASARVEAHFAHVKRLSPRSRLGQSCRNEPSDTLATPGSGRSKPLRCRSPSLAGSGHVNATHLARPEVPSTTGDH